MVHLSSLSLYTNCARKNIGGHLGPQGQKRSSFKQRQMAKWCQHVPLGQTCKSFHGDLFVRPTIMGSKVKFQTTLNGKTNGVNMLALGKHANVSTVTSLSYLRFRGQRSKKETFIIRNQYKDVYKCLLTNTDFFLSFFLSRLNIRHCGINIIKQIGGGVCWFNVCFETIDCCIPYWRMLNNV